jgi:flagellin-specific chaperone FliS
MLQEQDRLKLDGIVSQMIANNESEDNIQFVVNDFKQKYSALQATTEAQAKPFALPGQETAQALATGVGKGIVSTVRGLANIGKSITGLTGIKEAVNTEPILTSLYDVSRPVGTAENIGYGTEKIAEFLLPSTKVAGAVKAVQTGVKGTGLVSGLARAGIKVAGEGVSTGAISTVQQGEVNDDVKTNAIAGSLFSAGGSLLGKAISGAGKVGQKIQQTVIKPSARDIENGFNINNLKKYNLGGSNEQVLAKSQITLNKLSQELNAKLAGSNQSLNLNDIYKETVDSLSGAKAKDFGNIAGTKRVLEALKNEIAEVAGPNGLVSIPEGQLVKQGAGTKGSWVFGSADPDATAIEKVYNTFYNKLKVAIEKNSPEGVKEINKQISEIIPITNAVIRRIPIENRASAISLNDSVALFGSIFSPKALALLGAGRLAKSGRFGNFLVNISDKLKGAFTATGVGQRFIGN